MSNANDTPAAPRARPSQFSLVWIALAAIAIVAVLGGRADSEPKNQREVDIAYLLVFGDGPISRAWYDGAPSPGVPTQDALDYFAKEGYHVVRTTDSLRAATKGDDTSFAIILERPRP